MAVFDFVVGMLAIRIYETGGAERMHAERSAAVAKAGDLSVLLAAMERLGG